MIDISTSFCGLPLKSPIIAASAPPTKSVEAIIKCYEAGAGAVVTKSTVDYNRSEMPSTPRRTFRHPSGQWSIQGSFGSETLTLDEALTLHRAVRSKVDIPIISSVGYLGGDPQQTVDTCCHLAEAGSSMIHLDLFYTPQPRSADASLLQLSVLIEAIKRACPLPITAKLNLDYPAQLMASSGVLGSLDGIFLLDSVRMPITLDNQGNGIIPNLEGAYECSLFGSWQKPLTLQYTQVLTQSINADVCAGGGLQNATDILQVIELGASASQFATSIMVHGAKWIQQTNTKLREQLSERGFHSLSEYRKAVRQQKKKHTIERATSVRAEVDANSCINCDVCTNLMFCGFISRDMDKPPQIAVDCTGCGFCVPLCPTQPKSIRLVPHTQSNT